MRAIALVAAFVLALPLAGRAAEPLLRTVAAPLDRVWAATESALRAEGWDIDRADRPTGTITTRSRRLEGDDDGLQATNRRVRLHLRLVPVAPAQTSVRVERELFIRERVLWIEKDRPLPPSSTDPAVPPDLTLEQRVLTAIGKAL